MLTFQIYFSLPSYTPKEVTSLNVRLNVFMFRNFGPSFAPLPLLFNTGLFEYTVYQCILQYVYYISYFLADTFCTYTLMFFRCPTGPTLSTSTSSFEALDPHDPNLSHLATTMFQKTADYLLGEITVTQVVDATISLLHVLTVSVHCQSLQKDNKCSSVNSRGSL